MSAAPGPATAQVIWLTDLHFETAGFVQGHDPRLRLNAAVDHINQHYSGADLCLITGDLVDTPTSENYAAVRAGLDRLTIPWWPMTGNHDSRAAFLEHMPLPADAMSGFAQYVIDLPVARLICLDSLWEGKDAGLLCAGRLNWLEVQLDASAKPALIFLHHPPLDLGLPMLDPDRLSNGDALLALLAGFPQVRQLCCGHVHRPIVGRAGDLSYATIRAVLYQAPPPVPAWDWDSFAPPLEAPDLGVIDIQDDQITIQFAEFCAAAYGGASELRDQTAP